MHSQIIVSPFEAIGTFRHVLLDIGIEIGRSSGAACRAGSWGRPSGAGRTRGNCSRLPANKSLDIQFGLKYLIIGLTYQFT